MSNTDLFNKFVLETANNGFTKIVELTEDKLVLEHVVYDEYNECWLCQQTTHEVVNGEVECISNTSDY